MNMPGTKQLGATATEVVGVILPQIEALRKDVGTFMEESRKDRRELAETQAQQGESIAGLRRDVDRLSIIDKTIAIISAIGAAVAGVLFGK